jgi:hypothetical protein
MSKQAHNKELTQFIKSLLLRPSRGNATRNSSEERREKREQGQRTPLLFKIGKTELEDQDTQKNNKRGISRLRLNWA